ERIAAVAGDQVAIVAGLQPLLRTVAARGCLTHHARYGAVPTRLELAEVVAAIGRHAVAVVTLLGALDEAVAADRGHAGHARHRARVADVDRTVGAARAAAHHPVVALFESLDDPVATDRQLAGHAG